MRRTEEQVGNREPLNLEKTAKFLVDFVRDHPVADRETLGWMMPGIV
jgi:hypothetical protein